MAVKPDSVSKPEKKNNKQDELSHLAKAIISGAGVGIYIVQCGKFVYVSEFYQKLSGYKDRELIGTYSLNNIYPDDREMVREKAIECLKRKSFGPYEYRFVKNNNEIMWVLETVTPIIYKEERAALGSFMDITRRKKAEESLRQSEDKYRTILETIQEGYFELDLAGNFTFVNDSMCRLYGYSRKEITGMNYRQYTDKENAKKLFQSFHKVYTTGKPLKESSWQAIRKDGTKIYVEASALLHKNSSGKPIGFKGIIRDITERMKIEGKLRDEEQRFRALAEQSSDIIVMTNRKGLITYENPAVGILGIDAKKRIGASAFDNVHPDDLKRIKNMFNNLFNNINAPISRSEVRILHKDGSWRIFEITASVLTRGNIVESVIANLRDITERKRTEEKILFEGQRFRALADHSMDIILLLDPKGVVTYINPAVEKILGYKVEERIGARALDPIHPNDLKSAIDKLKKLATETNAPVFQMEMRLADKEGNWHTFETVGSNLVKDNAVEAIIIRQHDITKRKQAETKLQESEANYRQLFDNSPAAIYQIDYKTGKFLKANDAFCKYVGCNQEEIVSLSPYDILTEESRKLFIERMEKISLGIKVPEIVEFEALDRKGKQWSFQLHIKNIYDAKGHVVAADVVAHDITERKKAEEELKRFAEDLEDTNIALRVLMNKRGEDQREFEEKLQVNINDLVIPYLKKLSNLILDDRNKNYLSVLESNLSDVLSPFMRDFRSSHKNLTPQEIQIVELIKKGKNTKEIADMLNASANTIATHRNNIRKKLNLRNSKINLRSHILSLK